MLPCQLHNSVLLHLKNMKLCQNRRELKSLMVRYSIWPVKLDDHPLLIAQPDIMIVCDTDKLDRKRCNGAPDFIIEIVSPSNSSDDYIKTSPVNASKHSAICCGAAISQKRLAMVSASSLSPISHKPATIIMSWTPRSGLCNSCRSHNEGSGDSHSPVRSGSRGIPPRKGPL